MNQPAIRVVDLSKEYHIGLRRPSNRTIREAIVDAVKGPFRRTAKLLRGDPTGAAERGAIHVALKDVSFEIPHGDVLGVIGQNGAGKSTLLKILSRITEPSRGFAQIRGRVGSLLEVGTGFHPELTGRENIYLNGAILGMHKTEIERKFDEIVAFAEIDKFLETPVKHYSSGMYMRLAFSVAAHLEPEILLVDEVLSVGDVAFQKKCLGKMNQVHQSGRTVLFVSHNMATIENLCTTTIVLNEGQIAFMGASKEAVQFYLEGIVDRGPLVEGVPTANRWANPEHRKHRSPEDVVSYTRIEFKNLEGKTIPYILPGEPLVIRLHYSARKSVTRPIFGVGVSTESGTLVSYVSTWLCSVEIPVLEPGNGFIDLCVDYVNLMPGTYFVSVMLGGMGPVFYDSIDRYAALTVEESDFYRSGRMLSRNRSIMLLPCHWEPFGSAKENGEPAQNLQNTEGEGLVHL